MSTPELNPVSFVVLGLIARDGPSTPYDLEVAAAKGVAHFWPFGHSHLYRETQRLAAAGLLDEAREEGGRRRRVYTLTRKGRTALESWLADPAGEPLQLRSVPLLKLYFAQFASAADRAELAANQVDVLDRRWADYAEIDARLAALGDRPYQRVVLAMGLACERVLRQEWAALAEREAKGGVPGGL